MRRQNLTPEELAEQNGIDPRTHEFWALMRLHDLTEEEEDGVDSQKKPKRQEKAAVRSLFRQTDSIASRDR
ncbi:MAG: hypothetical protein KY455_02265 [Euryarchaeota archaeon]|nr:hypothetical protein [Euryarchaeota archaeon]